MKIGWQKMGFDKWVQEPKTHIGLAASNGFLSTGGSQAISPMEWSLFWSSIGSRDKGEEDKSVAFLSALDEEHRRWDKIEGCEL